MITTTTASLLASILVALITAVFGPIAVNWVKLKMEKKSSTPMKDALEIGTIIDNQLDDMLDELECDRIWIAQFHNGGHFYPTGRSIQKFSIFYEKTTPTTPSIQTTFQNIPVSLFPQALSKIYKDNELAVFDATLDEENYGVDILTTQFGTRSTYMMALHSLDDHIIGVLGISYKEPKQLEKGDWIYFREKTGVIGTLLSKYLYASLSK